MELQPINLQMPPALRDAFSDPKLREAFNDAVGGEMYFAVNKGDDDETLELLVMGNVGDKFEGLGADQIVRALAEHEGRRINVRINSPGGIAYDGIQIFNALIQHEGGVTTTVEGQAGSAASIIAMAGNPVRMFENTTNFMHRSAWGLLGFFNALTLRDLADGLDSLDDAIVRTYVAKTGLSARKVNQLLDGRAGDGTTLTAREAQKLGFADEVVELKRPAKAKNSASVPETVTSTESVVAFTVPGNPPNGEGFASTATWAEPGVSDFTADSWSDVGPNTRAAIARHFALAPEDVTAAEFDEFLLPHHNPDGTANLDAVKAALDRLDEVPEDVRADVEAHLRAHIPERCVDAELFSEVERRMVELRLKEIA